MPDIPRGPGEQLMELGEGMRALGMSLTGLSAPTSVLKAAEFDQLTQFQLYANARVNKFQAELDQNPNPEEYKDAWDELAKEISDMAPEIGKLPGARLQIERWWAAQQDTEEEKVYTKQRTKWIAKAEVTNERMLQELIANGDEEGTGEFWDQSVAYGLKKSEGAAENKAKDMAQARYNGVLNMLQTQSYEDALAIISNPNFGEQYRLDDAQQKKLKDSVSFQYATSNEVAERKLKESQTKAMDEFLLRSTSLDNPLSRDDAITYLASVASDDKDSVMQYIKGIDTLAEKEREAQYKYDKGTVYGQYATSMDMWSGSGKIPWDMNDVNKLLVDKKIEREEFTLLQTLYNQAIDEIKNGKRGPFADDLTKVAEMVRIVYDDSKKSTDKIEEIKPFFANGVSPQTWTRFRSDIDELNLREDWKTALAPINAYYNAAIIADSENRQKLAVEQAEAQQAMIRIFRQYPKDEAAWKQARDSIMDKNVLPELLDQMQKQIQARFPNWQWFTRGVPESMQLETIAEQVPSEFAKAPGLQARRSMAATQIAEEERKILKQSNIAIVDSYRDPDTGDWYYSTRTLVRDENGKVDLKAIAKSGALYQVKSVNVNGKIIQKAGRVGIK